MQGDFPGGPVVKTPGFHCRGQRFDPGWRTKTSHALWCGQKIKSQGGLTQKETTTEKEKGA